MENNKTQSQSKIRTELADDRTELAKKRTYLANTRTFLSYVRTCLILVSVALAFFKIEKRVDWIIILLIVVAIVLFVIGLIHYLAVRTYVRNTTLEDGKN